MSKFDHLVFHVPRENAGQMVEVAFACDNENELVVRRTTNKSSRTTFYEVSYQAWQTLCTRTRGLWDAPVDADDWMCPGLVFPDLKEIS